MPLPASGGASFRLNSRKIIRFARHGCTNRPFYHIVVMETRKEQFSQAIEQVGTYDPLENEHNERLVALNFERIRYWLGMGADTSKPVSELFGLVGFFPIHPQTYMQAWRNRKKTETEKAAAEKEKSATGTSEEQDK